MNSGTIGTIETLFKDRLQENPVFPRTKTRAITDDQGNRLDVILEDAVYVGDREMGSSSVPIDVDTLGGIAAEEYSTKSYVLTEIAKAQLNGGDVNLDGFATKDDLTLAKKEVNQTTEEKIAVSEAELKKNFYSLSGSNIKKEQDLDLIIEPGTYQCTVPSTVKTFKNCPVTGSFKMYVGRPAAEVDNNADGIADYIDQELKTLNGITHYRSSYTSNGERIWRPWRKITDANQPDASVALSEAEHLKYCKRFVEEMNNNAKILGLKNSTFNTPSGYCGKMVYNGALSTSYNSYITAYDLLRLLIAARHIPAAYNSMSTSAIGYMKEESFAHTYNFITGSDSWKDWATEHGYEILAGKGGSLTGNYGENTEEAQYKQNGILNMGLIVKDANNTYVVAVLGLDNPIKWKENSSYSIGRKVEYTQIIDGETITTCHISKINNNNSVPTNTDNWDEIEKETSILREIIHELIDMVANKETAPPAGGVISTTVAERPWVTMAISQITSAGTYDEDIALLDDETDTTNKYFLKADKIKVAASVTKILAVITAAPFLADYECTISKNDIVGGSGIGVSVGDTFKCYDVINLLIGTSDNALTTMIARICGKKMSAFAPGNFGLGIGSFASGSPVRITNKADLDNIKVNSFWAYQNKSTNPEDWLDATYQSTQYVHGYTIASNKSYVVQRACTVYTGVWIERYFGLSGHDGEWSPWHYVNPPLTPKKEYLTTEKMLVNDALKNIWKKRQEYGGEIFYKIDGETEWRSYSGILGAAPIGHISDKNNPHGVTAEQIQAAPAGYGLGTQNGIRLTSTDNLNYIIQHGWYDWVTAPVNAPIDEHGYPMSYCIMRTWSGCGAFYIQEVFQADVAGPILRRYSMEGADKWQPWEWVNPPMIEEKEYRTTERWNGKPVYTKLINLGNPKAGNDTKQIGILGVAGSNQTGYIRHYAFTSTGRAVQSWGTTVEDWGFAIHIADGLAHINCGAGIAGNNEIVYLQVWYIRN